MNESDKKPVVFINPYDKVSPVTLASLINRSPTLLYQWSAAGRLPNFKDQPFSYIECLDHLVTHLVNNEESKKLKVQEEIRIKEELYKQRGETRGRKFADINTDDDSNIHPLVAAKLKQNVKTEYAREAQLWQAIAIKNGEYVNFNDKLNILEPFILQIRDLLLGIAIDFPETQMVIDEGMENLYNLGMKILEETREDREAFVDAMLAKEVEKDA